MDVSLSTIRTDVRVILDKNMSGEALAELGDIDTLSLDEMIESKVVDAVRLVHSSAPYYRLDGLSDLSGDVVWDDLCCGHIILPDDFMRLVSFKMSDWQRSVHEAIDVSDARYALQGSKYKGVRGTPEKPVVAAVPYLGGLALEFFSCRSEDATISAATYLPLPQWEDGTIAICKRLYRSACHMTAALCALSMGSVDTYNALSEQAKNLME